MNPLNTTDLRRTALRLRYHDIGMSDEVNCAAAEIDALRTRLEIDDKTGYDGIECRDMTISGQDKLIDGLRADNKRLREALLWNAGALQACCSEGIREASNITIDSDTKCFGEILDMADARLASGALDGAKEHK